MFSWHRIMDLLRQDHSNRISLILLKKYTLFTMGKTQLQKAIKWLKPHLQPFLGAYYGTLHIIIMLSCATVLLFDNNAVHLIIMFNLLAVDALSCIILKNCPLTILERKYLGKTWMTTRFEVLQNLGIDHKCSHEYEATLETLMNMGGLFILKLSVLFILTLFPFSITVNKPKFFS
jgi:hypothetical protein